MKITELVRENIRELQPYSCAREEYAGNGVVLLDANENPYNNGCNRYPDPYQSCLKETLSVLKGIVTEQMVIGNGSDEIIDLLVRSFCRPEKDNIIVFSPGYSMYEVVAAINAVEVRKINLRSDFQPDWEEAGKRTDGNTRIIFLCTPNNPTGILIPLEDVEAVCRNFGGLVVVDEAYIDFANAPSALSLLGKYENLIVLQTLSKSWGMAGLRIGVGYAGKEVIGILSKVKAPYNVSVLSQEKAVGFLRKTGDFYRKVKVIKKERERLYRAFIRGGWFEKVYPSEANFILVTLEKYDELYRFLIAGGMVIRLRDIPPLIKGGLRITVGTRRENDRLLGLLKKWDKCKE